VKALQKRLKDFAKGKVAPKTKTVAAALQEWYKFRDQNKLGNTKAKQMGGKLEEWCEKNDIPLLTVFTTEKAMACRNDSAWLQALQNHRVAFSWSAC